MSNKKRKEKRIGDCKTKNERGKIWLQTKKRAGKRDNKTQYEREKVTIKTWRFTASAIRRAVYEYRLGHRKFLVPNKP